MRCFQARSASLSPGLGSNSRPRFSGFLAGLGGTITNVYLSCDAPGSAPSGAWTGVNCTSNGQGNVVSVRVVYTYNPITPIVGPMVGSVVRQAAATMVIN